MSRTFGQVVRSLGLAPIRPPIKMMEAVRMLEDSSTPIEATPGMYDRKMKVLLITEGLGNRVNMHFYGPEAIESGPSVFEGASCYLDHPSVSEEDDIPERRVRAKCGYFTDCKVEMVGGLKGVTGILHFDASESGDLAYQKGLTALQYQRFFPNKEYVGFSIYAQGESEDRSITYQGEEVDVNYVKRFFGQASCDMVTTPARGGKFLALVESAAGARKKRNKEAGMKLTESLKAAHTALDAANKESDPEKRKTLLADATAKFNACMEEAEAAAERTEEAEEAANEAKTAAEALKKKLEKEAKKVGKKPMADDDDEDGDEDDDKDDDKVESHRLAVKALIAEANLEKFCKPEEFAGQTLAQVKESIKAKSAFRDQLLTEAAKTMDVPLETITGGLRESNPGSGAGNDFLSDCMKK